MAFWEAGVGIPCNIWRLWNLIPFWSSHMTFHVQWLEQRKKHDFDVGSWKRNVWPTVIVNEFGAESPTHLLKTWLTVFCLLVNHPFSLLFWLEVCTHILLPFFRKFTGQLGADLKLLVLVAFPPAVFTWHFFLSCLSSCVYCSASCGQICVPVSCIWSVISGGLWVSQN